MSVYNLQVFEAKNLSTNLLKIIVDSTINIVSNLRSTFNLSWGDKTENWMMALMKMTSNARLPQNIESGISQLREPNQNWILLEIKTISNGRWPQNIKVSISGTTDCTLRVEPKWPKQRFQTVKIKKTFNQIWLKNIQKGVYHQPVIKFWGVPKTILLFLWIRSPCKISEAYNNHFWGFERCRRWGSLLLGLHIDTSGNFPAHMSAESPSNIPPTP